MPKDDSQKITDALDFDWSELFPPLRATLGAMAVAGAADTIAELGFAPDDSIFAEVAPATAEWAAARAADLIGMRWEGGRLIETPNSEFAISESTREMLHATINDALEGGWSAAKVRDEIMQNYGFSASRALNIARTERSMAQNRGSLEAAKASGVVTGKEWVRGGDLPCDECEAGESDGVIGLDDIFSNGEESPPGHPSCVCNLSYSIEAGEVAENEEEE